MAELERFVAELRAADSVLASERMDAVAARRIARRLAAIRRARRVWWRPYVPAMCFAAGAVLVLVLHVWQQRRPLVADATPSAEQSALQDPALSCEEPTTSPAMPAAALPPVVVPAEVVVPAAEVAPPRAVPARAPAVPRDRTATVAVPTVEREITVEDRVAALLAELRKLRRAGRYAEAARRLEGALAESWPARAREVLHYELGTIVGSHLDDRERACDHWRVHLRDFPSTRYARAIAEAQQRLACE